MSESADEPPQVELPSALARAIADRAGGRVVIVAGAGVSTEAPTSLPNAWGMAGEAYRRLVADGVLTGGACSNPEDLSAVADAVYDATGGSQRELVERLPNEEMRGATPNIGHLLAVGLLRERALASVLTLNFDLAFSAAINVIGDASALCQVRGPGEEANLGLQNLIYLNRTANHDPDDWILRSEALETAWTEAWEEAIATRTLTTPVVVFVGLGSSAGVLRDVVQRLKRMLNHAVDIYQVDLARREDNEFALELGIDDPQYLEMAWTEFMRHLARRVLEEVEIQIEQACEEMQTRHEWPTRDVSRVLDSLFRLDLLELGGLLARWMIDDDSYLSWYECDELHIADIVDALQLIEDETETDLHVTEKGIVEYWSDTELVGTVVPVSGRGQWYWGAIEPRIAKETVPHLIRPRSSLSVLVCGAIGTPPDDLSTPKDIASPHDADDITTNSKPDIVDAETIRLAHPAARNIFHD